MKLLLLGFMVWSFFSPIWVAGGTDEAVSIVASSCADQLTSGAEDPIEAIEEVIRREELKQLALKAEEAKSEAVSTIVECNGAAGDGLLIQKHSGHYDRVYEYIAFVGEKSFSGTLIMLSGKRVGDRALAKFAHWSAEAEQLERLSIDVSTDALKSDVGIADVYTYPVGDDRFPAPAKRGQGQWLHSFKNCTVSNLLKESTASCPIKADAYCDGDW